MHFDPVLEEQLAALSWGIPLHKWYGMSRVMRIGHMAVVVAKDLATYYNAGGE